jgi:hypothetical protein
MAASDGSVHMLLEGLTCAWVRPKGILLHSNRPNRVSALWVDMDLVIPLPQVNLEEDRASFAAKSSMLGSG